MNVNIKSKPNQELKYIDPNFDKTDVPEDDWEFIYCLGLYFAWFSHAGFNKKYVCNTLV